MASIVGTASQQAFGNFGTAASDLFAGFAASDKIKGDQLEAASYGEAASLALQNEQFTKVSTGIQEAQQQRELNLSLGRTQSEIAGAGFTGSGSGLDILRSSAAQGSIQKAVTGQQGLITEAGYQEQANAYTNMESAAYAAAKGEKMAQTGDFIAAGTSAAAGIAALL